MRLGPLAAAGAMAFLCGMAFGQGKATIGVGEIEFRAMDSAENKRYRAYGENPREDTRAFVDMLTTAIVQTGKFNVVERDRMEEILKEQGLALEGIAGGGYEGSSFNLQGVDYIVTGAITEYGQKAQAARFGGFSGASETAAMAVDIRVLEVATGSIGIAETVRAEASMGGGFEIDGVAKTGESDSSAALGDVMRKTARGVTRLIVSSIFPIRIVRVQSNGDVMLNYGKALLGEGDVLEVFSQGEAFTDPDTGEELGREEELIGKLSVASVQDRFSKAQVIEGQGVADGMIARVTNEVVNSKGEVKEKKKRRLF